LERPPALAHRIMSEPFRSNYGRRISFTLLMVAMLLHIPDLSWAQQAPASDPAAPPATPASSGQPDSPSPSSSSKGKKKVVPSFLIIGSVFDEKPLSFPGVQVRIRRAGEKKFRWETFTNSRGEFAVRVPPGTEYEVVLHMKNYQDQSQTVDSKVEVQQRLSIKLEPRVPSKSGAKP
jgi:hypothetical protein